MTEPFIGEIRILPYVSGRTPAGWTLCDGKLLSINGNEMLYSIIGTTYGGDGMTNFAVPDLRGRVPVGQGQGTGLTNRVIGQTLGTETVTLTVDQMPAHTHALTATTNAATATAPQAGGLASAVDASSAPPVSLPMYKAPTSGEVQAMSAQSTDAEGGGQAHCNMAPYMVMQYWIALVGLYPVQN